MSNGTTQRQQVFGELLYWTGQTAADIAKTTGIKGPSVRRVIRELVAAGAARKAQYGTGYIRV